MVMWYSHLTAYANDLTEQTVGPWHDGFGGAFAEFIRPLVPQGSSCMRSASGKHTADPVVTESADGEEAGSSSGQSQR